MFATVVVILPSAFEGGHLYLSHSGQTKICDVSDESAFRTSIISWYADVDHDVKPITSGYRLALSFSLTGPTGLPRPTLSGFSHTLASVRRVLMSWRQSDKAPKKLVYLLDQEYSSDDFDTEDFERTDGYRIATLNSLARQCRFKIYFSKAALHKIACVSAENPYAFMEGEKPRVSLTVKDIVDIDGDSVDFAGESIEFSHPGDFIPRPLDARAPKESIYPGHVGTVSRSKSLVSDIHLKLCSLSERRGRPRI